MMENLEVRQQWPTMRARRLAERPGTVMSPATRDDWCNWVYSRFVRGADATTTHSAIDAACGRAMHTKRHWLALDGPATIGKSELLADYLLSPPVPPRVNGIEPIPAVYLQAGTSQQGRGLLEAICRFCSVPPAGSEETIRSQLFEVLPKLGTRLIVVDDAHMFRRSQRSSVKTTDTLRATLRLPVTFVFAGVDLNKSALLYSQAGDGFESTAQLLGRHSRVELRPAHGLEAQREIVAAIADLRGTLQRVPGLQLTALSDPRCVRSLVDSSRGLLGQCLASLKDAVASVVSDQTLRLTPDVLRAHLPFEHHMAS